MCFDGLLHETTPAIPSILCAALPQAGLGDRAGGIFRIQQGEEENSAMRHRIDGSLLVHIAYHHEASVDRTRYLRNQLQNILETYPLDRIEIVVDTNHPSGKESIAPLLAEESGYSIRCKVHARLSHPFLLTWAHREPMGRRIGEFDYYMYCEDDLIIPWKSFEGWRTDTELLGKHDFVRGFIRTETREDGSLVALDFPRVDSDPRVVDLGSRGFYVPRFPYHGFFLYTRRQMQIFAGTPENWDRKGNCCPYRIREKAASGRAWKSRVEHRVLLPLDTSGALLENPRVVHQPCNYVNNPATPYGKLDVDMIILEGSGKSKQAAGR